MAFLRTLIAVLLGVLLAAGGAVASFAYAIFVHGSPMTLVYILHVGSMLGSVVAYGMTRRLLPSVLITALLFGVSFFVALALLVALSVESTPKNLSIEALFLGSVIQFGAVAFLEGIALSSIVRRIPKGE